jgi:hypothetical protein
MPLAVLANLKPGDVLDTRGEKGVEPRAIRARCPGVLEAVHFGKGQVWLGGLGRLRACPVGEVGFEEGEDEVFVPRGGRLREALRRDSRKGSQRWGNSAGGMEGAWARF